MNDSNKPMSSAVVVGVVALVLGLVVGFGINYLVNKNQTQKNMDALNAANSATMVAKQDIKTPAANLRVILNTLETDHVRLAANAIRRVFNGDPDASNAETSLDNNSVALASAIGSVYGDDAKNQFLQIWRSHITFFVNYAVSAKKGDQAGVAKALTDLKGYVEAISTFFSSANPNLPKDAVAQLVTDHVNLLKSAVDSYAGNKYDNSYANEQKAHDQIQTIADAISGAVVKQYPDKFAQ